MQRVSQGRKVPGLAIDTFTGKTTNPFGLITCTLTYAPKSINHISVSYGQNVAADEGRWCVVQSLAGKVVTLHVACGAYDRPNDPTDVDVGSVGGAANHSHGLTFVATLLGIYDAGGEAQPPITIIYKPA